MENTLQDILGFLLALGVGLGCGSFATMPYYRLPHKEPCAGKWIGKKSHCTSCQHQLRTRDLIPVFNWLLTRGKCQFCHTSINPVYFFIELSVTLFSLIIFHHYGFNDLPRYIITLGLATCMVIITATEYSYRTIPDQLLIVAILFGFLIHSPEEFSDMIMVFTVACLAGIFYAWCYQKITHIELADFQHPKLLAVSGIWLTYGQWFIHAFLALILCLFIALLGRIYRTKRPLPFGFALTSALMINLLYPTWYRLFLF